jgi:hypothetical protein
MAVGLAQFLTIKDASGKVLHKWQNHWAGQTVLGFSFKPFTVTSLLSRVSAGAESAQIDFPSVKDISDLIETGMSFLYVATVEQHQYTPPVSGLPSSTRKLASFTGEFQSAEFNESTCSLEIGANLDATESQAPPRSFTTDLVGFPPKL